MYVRKTILIKQVTFPFIFRNCFTYFGFQTIQHGLAIFFFFKYAQSSILPWIWVAFQPFLNIKMNFAENRLRYTLNFRTILYIQPYSAQLDSALSGQRSDQISSV